MVKKLERGQGGGGVGAGEWVDEYNQITWYVWMEFSRNKTLHEKECDERSSTVSLDFTRISMF